LRASTIVAKESGGPTSCRAIEKWRAHVRKDFSKAQMNGISQETDPWETR